MASFQTVEAGTLTHFIRDTPAGVVDLFIRDTPAGVVNTRDGLIWGRFHVAYLAAKKVYLALR